MPRGPRDLPDLGAGEPKYAKLEPGGGVPHRLGWAAEAGGVSPRNLRVRSAGEIAPSWIGCANPGFTAVGITYLMRASQ